MPSIKNIRRVLEYDGNTGMFRWRVRTSARCNKGWFKGYDHNGGYLVVQVLGRVFLAHRLGWMIFKGSIKPKVEIDHRNGDKRDNRIENLRPVSHRKNNQHARLRRTNTSGVTGVYWREDEKKWIAQICVDSKCIYLCITSRFEDAVAARKEAEEKYGFGT